MQPKEVYKDYTKRKEENSTKKQKEEFWRCIQKLPVVAIFNVNTVYSSVQIYTFLKDCIFLEQTSKAQATERGLDSTKVLSSFNYFFIKRYYSLYILYRLCTVYCDFKSTLPFYFVNII